MNRYNEYGKYCEKFPGPENELLRAIKKISLGLMDQITLVKGFLLTTQDRNIFIQSITFKNGYEIEKKGELLKICKRTPSAERFANSFVKPMREIFWGD